MTRMRTRAIPAFAAIVALFAASVVLPRPVQADTKSATIQNFAFHPPTLTITTGTKVTWTNQDDGVPHTATADPGSSEQWDTGNLDKGQSGSHTFDKPGTFTYHCAIHPSMHGTIIVTGAAVTPVPPAKFSLKVKGTLRAGHKSNLSVTVRNAGTQSPVAGVKLTLNGKSVGIGTLHASTGSGGIATFKKVTPKHAGKAKLSAAKSGFKNSTLSLTVKH